jgi:nucleoside-diphosphate-sugar epimerase
MKKVLITGGAGFFGELLKKELLNAGYICVSIDLEKDTCDHNNLKAIQGDIRNISLLDTICRETKFDAVYHCAAILAHAIKDKNFLWTSNVDGTRNVAEIAKKHSIPQVIFTSSNCLWAENFGRPVREDDAPRPVEIYGRSKWEGEKILEEYKDCFNAVIFRCPTIMDEGRLGLLAILFEFIDEGRKVWVVGGGDNVYQFIYAKDLINACIKALDYKRTRILNIGSDNVKPFRDVYNYVIDKAQTGARVASLPRRLTIFGMELAHKLKISPLGPYQYKMIAEDFVFDTTRIKNELNWRPTLTNEEMLFKAYKYYHENIQDIKNRKDVSAHKQAAPMGIIRLLKWIS